MEKQEQSHPAVNRRLTALWSLSEAGLGGLLHLLKLPLTGILVGGFSIVAIAMLAWHNRPRSAPVVRAWAIVSAIKFGLSPHSPLTAYLAVSFQAFFSLLCFRVIPHFRSACMLSGAVCTVESGLQRLLVLTLIFGVGLWKAVDAFTAKILEQFGFSEDFSGSQWIIGGYLLIHLIAGLLIGWWAGKLPQTVRDLPPDLLQALRDAQPAESEAQPAERKRKSLFRNLRAPLLLLLAGSICWYLKWPLAGILLRGGCILLLWMLLLQGPVESVVRRIARRLGGKYEPEVAEVRQELPAIRQQARVAWALASREKGFRRLPRFGSLFFALGLNS
ncbi:MAG: hypothetical protein RL742_1859 [Bacteroidota bacterium]